MLCKLQQESILSEKLGLNTFLLSKKVFILVLVVEKLSFCPTLENNWSLTRHNSNAT